MKVLELFAGSRSLGKAAEKLGMEVFSSDIEAYKGIDYRVDILKFDYSKVPFTPDIIWFSPPCTAFSVCAMWRHWKRTKNGRIPKSKKARECIKLAKKCLEIIDYYKPKYWFIENPRGMLRKMPFMEGLQRHTVTYCQYGDTRMKPTDVWTNSTDWSPKPMCHNRGKCHVSSPRGSKNGTQGLANAYERSKIPERLCLEILRSCKN